MRNVVWFSGVALLAFGLGYAVRAIATAPARSVTRVIDPQAPAGSALPSAVIRAGGANDPQVVALKERFAVSEGVASWLNLIAELERAAPEDMPRIAAAVGDESDGLRLVARRWYELGPDRMFADALAEAVRVGEGEPRFPCYELLEYLFDVWPKRDLAAAVDALEFDSDGEWAVDHLIDLRGHLLEAVVQFDYHQALEIAKRWDIELGYDTLAFRRWAKKNPRAALDAILDAKPTGGGDPDDPFGHVDWGDELDPIAEIWAARDPAEGLAIADELPHTAASAIREHVFALWAAKDREAATAWLQEHSSSGTQELLRATLVGEWAREDPAAALAWSQEHIDHPTHLERAVMRLVEVGAESDPEGVAAVVAGIDDSNAKEFAYTALAEAWFPKFSHEDPPPAEAIDWLRDIESHALRERVVSTINRRWIHVDPEGFRSFLDEPRNAALGISPYINFARSMARHDPHDTLEWAESLGGDRAQYVTFAAFDAWIPHRPAAAVEWFQALPATDIRRPEFLRRIAYQASANPAHQLILENLSAADRAEVLASIEDIGLSEEDKRRLRGVLGE